MKTNTIAASILVLMISGCASVSTPMKHADGRVMNCSAAGFGIVGTPAALVMRENCVTNARENGFVPIEEGGPAQNTTYAGKTSISLPDGWVRSTAPAGYPSAIAFAKNTTLDAYMALTSVDKKTVTDVATFAETKKSTQESKLREATSTAIAQASINGKSAYEAEITGVLPANGIRYHFKSTIIDNDQEILVLAVWVPASNYAGKVKEHLDSLPSGIN